MQAKTTLPVEDLSGVYTGWGLKEIHVIAKANQIEWVNWHDQ